MGACMHHMLPMQHGCIQFVAALVVALLAGHARAEGKPPMLHEVISGLGAGLGRTSAGVLTSSDYYHAEKSSVKFSTSEINNCNFYGGRCNYFFKTCQDGCLNTIQVPQCKPTEIYAETQLTCTPDQIVGEHHRRRDSIFTDAVVNQAGSCNWEIRPFGGDWPIYADNGKTQKVGTVRGMCTITGSAEACNDDNRDGPLCGGMIITIDAHWLQTDNAWWKFNTKVNIARDMKYDKCTAAGYPACPQDSCCLLGPLGIGLVSTTQCLNFRQQNERLDNTTSPGVTVQPSKFVPNADDSGAMQDHATENTVGTASYGSDESFGTYYFGSAQVFWGSFYVTNQATGEQWKDAGTFQWVVDTIKSGTDQGRPPSDRLELEPNSVRFDFTRKAPRAHRYTDASEKADKIEENMRS